MRGKTDGIKSWNGRKGRDLVNRNGRKGLPLRRWAADQLAITVSCGKSFLV